MAAPTKGADFGYLDKKGQSLKWFEVRSAEIASLAAKAGRMGVTEGMQRHFDLIAAKLRSAKNALAGLGDERVLWEARASHLGFSSINGSNTRALA